MRQFWRRKVLPTVFIALLAWLVGGFRILVPPPPADPDNLCQVFRQHPKWYDHALASEQRWGTPIATQMAFVRFESSFRSHVRPPRTRLFGVIPWRRPSSAYGYAQAQDPAWSDYMADVGHWLSQRSQMVHALDFIGWYNHLSNKHVGLSLANAEQLYLAYHEGRTGYRRGSYKAKPNVQRIASRVAAQASVYASQLERCEAEFRCRRFYQFGPFCD